ncbi:MAG: hypothetical protein IJF69_02745 [Clostridia bacterium]|nr:hypothetical protein [Clostridia bacterium]
MKETKANRQKKQREQKKLSRAVNTLASIVDSIATSMKADLKSGEMFDIKQLKELTGAAKELSALICALDSESSENEQSTVAIRFEGEGEEWAK